MQSIEMMGERLMNEEKDSLIIVLYNLHLLISMALIMFLMGFWTLETHKSEYTYGRGSGLPIAVLIVYIPEVILGLKCNLRLKSVNILCSLGVAYILYKLFYHNFMVKTNAPVTFYSTMAVMAADLFWIAVIEFSMKLREHILQFPQNQWLIPCSTDQETNRTWHILWGILVLGLGIISILISWRLV